MAGSKLGSLNQYPGRAHSQPGRYFARNSPRQADRGHRGLRLRQVEPGIRHALCRRTAALRAESLDLRAAVPGADGAAGRRCDFGDSAGARAAQKNTIKNARSTVGTVTEISDYLRLLFATVGHTICPRCGGEVSRDSVESAGAQILGAPGLYVMLAPFEAGIAIDRRRRRLPDSERVPSPVRQRRDHRDRGVCRACDSGRSAERTIAAD